MQAPKLNADEIQKHLISIAQLCGFRLLPHGDDVGDKWEAECIREFEKIYGKDKVRNVASRKLPHDIVVCGLRIQCKVRSPKSSGAITIGKGAWDLDKYKSGKVDIFAIKCGKLRLVIPFKRLVTSRGMFRNDIHPDRFWRYVDRWAICDASSIGSGDSDLPLFNNADNNLPS